MNVSITFCMMWNYAPQAVSLATNLLNTFRQGIKNLNLIPSGGGVFDVEVNGKLIFSKKAVGRFPDETALVNELKAKYPTAA